MEILVMCCFLQISFIPSSGCFCDIFVKKKINRGTIHYIIMGHMEIYINYNTYMQHLTNNLILGFVGLSRMKLPNLYLDRKMYTETFCLPEYNPYWKSNKCFSVFISSQHFIGKTILALIVVGHMKGLIVTWKGGKIYKWHFQHLWLLT